jgi:hypothetical protein
MREGVGAEVSHEGERISQLGLYRFGRSFVGERLILRRGRLCS